ncbi:MAG: bifunctional phosphoribosylaminoimidazolecarboxamide formyltransferase/IMP cyclohydrolase [Microbacteriaceae bacterium]
MSGHSHDPSLYTHRDQVTVRRALLSVSDKTGLLDLAGALVAAGVELVSTGSTAARISEAGYPVTEVSSVTGFPESLDGRVKTLHPAIHAGILADLRLAHHGEELARLEIAPFDLVVVNLYPFAQTVASGAQADAVVEQIDIGGPAMVRAAAKNHANVAVVVDPARYQNLIAAVAAGGTTLQLRRTLAAEAFAHTADYDRMVAAWFAGEPVVTGAGQGADAPAEPEIILTAADLSHSPTDVPDGEGGPHFTIEADLGAVLRYGENPHQQATLYLERFAKGVAQAVQLHGKEMSYNNFVDADAAVRAAFDFFEPAVAIIKHTNPCGIAVGSPTADDPIADAYLKAHATDPVSAFGGVIASNREVTLAFAESVREVFTEVIIAPSFTPEALEVLRSKKNLRLLQLPDGYRRSSTEFRQISGGVLVQTADTFEKFSSVPWQRVSGSPANDATLADLEFAWRAVRSVKSNAILLASAGAAVGVGMGQVNRVDASRLAVNRARGRAFGSVAASDAFFPFADGLEILLEAGVKAVVAPGGSVRDEEVIAVAMVAGITMYHTGERHFYH